MKVPRFRITWLMILVAIAAVNFAAIRYWYQLRIDGNAVNNTVEVLTYGTLPMANLLVAGIVVGLGRPETRPFLWGFELFGAAALALFVPLAYFYTEEGIQSFILWFLRLRPLQTVTANFGPTVQIPVFYSIATLLVGVPQLAFALVGGLVFRKFGEDRCHTEN